MNRLTRTLFRSLLRWNKSYRNTCFTLQLESELLGLDQAIVDIVPQSLRLMTSEEDMKKVVRHIYRAVPQTIISVENAFRALRNLNGYTSQLKILYAQHSTNLNPDINEKAIFKVGQVCKHIARGYRGIVVGWEIMADDTQKVEVLVDSVDFHEFTKVYTEKTKFVTDDEMCLVFDDDLLRIHNDFISQYFSKYDSKLRRYIPVKGLLFRYPRDFDNVSITALERLRNSLSGKQSGNSSKSSNKVKYSESKEILDLQSSHDKVNETIADLCQHLYSIIQQYDVPVFQSLNNHELSQSSVMFPNASFSSKNVNGTSDESILSDIFIAIKEIERMLENNKIVSSPNYVQLYHSFIPLWGNCSCRNSSTNSNIKNATQNDAKMSSTVFPEVLNYVNNNNPKFLSATKYASYSALGHLANLYHVLDQILMLRFQRHGICYIESLLDLHAPVNNNRVHNSKNNSSIVSSTPKRSYMKGKYTAIKMKTEIASEVDISITPSIGIDAIDSKSTSTSASNSNIDGVVEPTDNDDYHGKIILSHHSDSDKSINNNHSIPSIVDTTHEPPVLFSVGQVVRHKIFNYRGVIFGWDQRPNQNVAHWEGIVKLKLKSEQPFYKILPDEDDVEAFLGAKQYRDRFYVAQENLELFQQDDQNSSTINTTTRSKLKFLQVPVRHRHVKAFFRGYDPLTGRFNVPPKLQFFFPNERTSVATTHDDIVASSTEVGGNDTKVVDNINTVPSSALPPSPDITAAVVDNVPMKSSNSNSHHNLSAVERALIQVYSVLKNSFSYTREESNNDINIHRNIVNDKSGKNYCAIEVCKFPVDRSTVEMNTSNNGAHKSVHNGDIVENAFSSAANVVVEHSINFPTINTSSSGTSHKQTAGMYLETFPILNMRDLLLLLKKSDNRDDAANVDSLLRCVFGANRNKDVNKLMRLGSSDLNRGNLLKARQSFFQAVCVDPNFSEAQMKVSALYNHMDDHSKCIHWSKLAIKQSPRHYHALGALAVSYEKTNRMEDAEKVIRRALTLHPWASHLPTVLQSILVRREESSSSAPTTENLKSSPSSSPINK